MKKIVFVIIGSFIILSLIAFNHYTRVYFNNNDKIIKNLNLLKQKELELNYEILSIGVYLYKNFDNVVILEKQIDNILDELENDPNFKETKKPYQDFLEYKKEIHNKIDKIYEIETFIAPLKNANMYIAELITKLPTTKISRKNGQIYLNLASQIFLIRNSFDLTFLNGLDKNIKLLKSQKSGSYTDVFIKNIEIFNVYFPLYLKELNSIINSNTSNILEKTFDDFLIAANDKLRVITIVSILLILFVITSISIILFLFFQIEKENKLLEKISITDNLTKLYNRRKLEMDIKQDKNYVFFIINIDKFKNYNDFYGTHIGDFILKQTALYIQSVVPHTINPSFYRIGADDFGVLFENKDIDFMKIANDIVEYFRKHTIIYEHIEFHIFVTIGISNTQPLLETADIALKTAKKDRKKSIEVYNEKFENKKMIEENLKKTAILKEAIDNDNIIPYFQPIFSNKTGEIVKYEVLARIKHNDEIMSIYPFLNIAKENKVYPYITKMIYEKAFKKFKNTNIDFSLNISIDDINNKETMEFIYDLVKKQPDIFQYVTFEILEDDAIRNYNLLKEFISYIKQKGSTIAVDDFGSGYSNFAHVLNLEIDYLKIDGSLIKNLNIDEKMELIVETIVEFSKKTNMKVIAEFVHSKEVLQKVKELGIDYSQGFYLGEPKADIIK